MKAVTYLAFPLLVFCTITWILAKRSILEIQFPGGNSLFSNTFLVKFVLTILFPLALINLTKLLKLRSGVYFGQVRNSLQIAFRSMSVVGPACAGFFLMSLLGWSFKEWYGSIMLTIFFIIALLFIPKITRDLETNNESEKKNINIIFFLAVLSGLAVIASIFLTDINSIIRKLLYYLFIVAIGEELLFRGYLQSSFNLFFGKEFKIGDVAFGWGLLISSLLFGLIHSLVVIPVVWPWMLFTCIGGIILGFVREKDGSLLTPIILHSLMNFPLIFM